VLLVIVCGSATVYSASMLLAGMAAGLLHARLRRRSVYKKYVAADNCQ